MPNNFNINSFQVLFFFHLSVTGVLLQEKKSFDMADQEQAVKSVDMLEQEKTIAETSETVEQAQNAVDETPKMSKNQMKRLLREQRRQETKAQWRKLQKDKRKLKELAKRQEYMAKGKKKKVLVYHLTLQVLNRQLERESRLILTK